jgi:hypothetical protein
MSSSGGQHIGDASVRPPDVSAHQARGKTRFPGRERVREIHMVPLRCCLTQQLLSDQYQAIAIGPVPQLLQQIDQGVVPTTGVNGPVKSAIALELKYWVGGWLLAGQPLDDFELRL